MVLLGVHDLEYQKWCKQLLRQSWGYIALITMAEVAIFLTMWALDSIAQALPYLLTYIVRPAVIHGGLYGITHLISLSLLKKKEYGRQAFLYITGVSIIISSVVWTHRSVVTANVLFAFPAILSLIFVSKRAHFYAFFLNLVGYGLYLGALLLWEPATMPNYMDILTTLTIIVGGWLISSIVLNRQLAMEQDVRLANQRSMQDSLTKMFNHAAFYERLDECIICNARDGAAFSLLIFDIDDFKRINDECGHDMGDEVLLQLVASIQEAVRPDEITFRYGGEEFTILSPRGAAECMALAERIRADFAERVERMKLCQNVTVSAGVCVFDPTIYTGRREFFASADEALYEAKRTGKNKSVLWTPQLLERP